MLWISNVLVLTFQALAQVSSLNTPCLDTILSLPCLRLYNGATSYVRELSLLAHSFSHFLSCHTQAHHRLSKYNIQCWESELVRIRYNCFKFFYLIYGDASGVLTSAASVYHSVGPSPPHRCACCDQTNVPQTREKNLLTIYFYLFCT